MDLKKRFYSTIDPISKYRYKYRYRTIFTLGTFKCPSLFIVITRSRNRWLGDRLKYVSLAVVVGLIGLSILASVLSNHRTRDGGKDSAS